MLRYIWLISVVADKKIVKIGAFNLLKIYLYIGAGMCCSTKLYQVVSVYTTVTCKVIMRLQRQY